MIVATGGGCYRIRNRRSQFFDLAVSEPSSLEFDSPFVRRTVVNRVEVSVEAMFLLVKSLYECYTQMANEWIVSLCTETVVERGGGTIFCVANVCTRRVKLRDGSGRLVSGWYILELRENQCISMVFHLLTHCECEQLLLVRIVGSAVDSGMLLDRNLVCIGVHLVRTVLDIKLDLPGNRVRSLDEPFIRAVDFLFK